MAQTNKHTNKQTNRQTDGHRDIMTNYGRFSEKAWRIDIRHTNRHGDSMTDRTQRAESVKNIYTWNINILTLDPQHHKIYIY